MAYKPKDFIELCMAWKMNVRVQINNHVGTINSITKEDGSGHGWNVELREQAGEGHETNTTYFRDC